MDHHEHMGNHRPPSLQKLPKRSNASHRPFPVVTFPLGRWNELCKSDRVTTLPRNSPMASDYTQNKNPRAVRPSMLWLLSTTPPSTSNLLHFVLSALVGPAFLLFLQHTKLVLNEPDPDSWSLHLLFPLPGISSSLRFLPPSEQPSLTNLSKSPIPITLSPLTVF